MLNLLILSSKDIICSYRFYNKKPKDKKSNDKKSKSKNLNDKISNVKISNNYK